MSFNDIDISNWTRVVEIFNAIEIEIDDDSERVVFIPIRANVYDHNVALLHKSAHQRPRRSTGKLTA